MAMLLNKIIIIIIEAQLALSKGDRSRYVFPRGGRAYNWLNMLLEIQDRILVQAWICNQSAAGVRVSKELSSHSGI